MKLASKVVVTLSSTVLWIGGLSAAELNRDYTTNLCPTGLNIPERPYVDAELELDDTYIIADEADLAEFGTSTLKGNTEITRNTQQVRANYVEYDEPADTADLKGDVNYWDQDIYLHSDDAFLTFDNGVGDFSNANFILVESRGRGQAERLVADVGTRTELENLRYTTCDPDDEFWHFTATKLDLDHEKNQGTARNFVLKIKDIPVFYSPYLSFPLSKERKSGFLAPGYGNTNDYGFEVRTPYYWNIAPQMDATLTPRLLSDTGVMAMGEFRYLTETGSGTLAGEYLPNDNKFDDKHRNIVSVDLQQELLGANFLVDYTRASDKFYLEDFGNQLSVTSASYLNQSAQLSYARPNWNLRALVQNYQIASPLISDASKPYKRLPHIYFDYAQPQRNRQFNFGAKNQLAYFYRDNGLANNVNGTRLDISPYVSYPMSNIYSFIKPKLGLRYTQYSLESNPTFKSSPSRVLPYFILDSGLFFERGVEISDKKITQTLEPRLFYRYVPKENQDDLPVFDTGLYTFTYNTLFLEDRFSSVDRMGDANQVTLAATSQFLDQQTGKNYGSVSFGQIFYLRDREITLPGYEIRDEGTSSFILNFNSNLIKNTSISGDFQWNPYVSEGTERITFRAAYNPEPGKIINFSYRVIRSNEINVQSVIANSNLGQYATDIEQTDVSFRWPITKNWSMVGRWNYSVPEGRSLETFGGVEYESCCWGARLVARRFLSNTDGDFETGIFMQLELKGLAGVGEQTVNFLRQQIPGYKSEF